MQALAAPIGGGEQRRDDSVPHRRAVAVIFVVERMGADHAAEIGAVLSQLFFAQRLRPAYQFAVHAAAPAFVAEAVLHDLDLHVVPVFPERRENAAVMRHVAVPVGRAFPHAHGGEMRRLQRGDVPLVHAVIGNAIEADFAGRPGLHARPFDAIVEIFGLARREMIDEPWRAAGAAQIHAHADVVVRHPFLRVDHFPALVEVAGAGGDVGMFFRHAIPGARIAVLEGEVLGVGAVGQDDRELPVFRRAENIGAQHQPVVHADRNVPIDPHAVAQLRQLLHRRHDAPPHSCFRHARACRGHPRLFFRAILQDVDGRDKPGHDGGGVNVPVCASPWPASPARRRRRRCLARRSRCSAP